MLFPLAHNFLNIEIQLIHNVVLVSGMQQCDSIINIYIRILTHLKRTWCWERLRVGGEGDDRGWDGWMASPTQWTWVWVDSGSWWWTGRPGVLQSTGSQRVRHTWATELSVYIHLISVCVCVCSVVQSCLILVTPWTAAHQAPLSLEFPRQKYWSGLSFPSPGDLLTQGSNPCLLRLVHWQVDLYRWATWEAHTVYIFIDIYFSFYILFHYWLLQDSEYSSNTLRPGILVGKESG